MIQNNKNRLILIDVLKGLAITLVVLSHSYSIIGSKNSLINSLIGQDTGRLGVLIFLLISGSLSYIFYRGGEIHSVSFVWNKIRKSWLLCAFGTTCMIILYLITNHTDNLFEFAISDYLLIKSYIPKGTLFAYSLNTPTWYLSSIILSWCLTPFFLKISKNMKTTLKGIISTYIFLIISLLFVLSLKLDSDYQRYFMYINPFVNSIIYFVGCLLGKYSLENKKFFSFNQILFLFIASYLLKDLVNIDLKVAFLLPSTSCLIIYLLQHNSINIPNICETFYSNIGKNSNTIFLLHYPICYYFRFILSNHQGIIPFSICFISSIFISIIIGNLILKIQIKLFT